MATAKIEITVPGMSADDLNTLIMGEGLLGESIFSPLFKDGQKYSVKYKDFGGEMVLKTYSNDFER